jgi:hypothetical protein
MTMRGKPEQRRRVLLRAVRDRFAQRAADKRSSRLRKPSRRRTS